MREVELAPIPLAIEVSSLRARAFVRTADGGEARVRVLGLSSSLMYAETENARQADVAREMNAIDAKVDRIDDAENTEAHVSGLLERYAAVATSTLSREWLERTPSFDKWSEAFDHLRDATEKLAVRRALRKLDRSRLMEKRADLLEEERRLGKSDRLGYRVKIALDALPGDARELRVELTYLTRAAQWMPIYDARLDASGATLALTSIALVRQSTGEDWENVELIATTARPPLSEPPPELVRVQVKSFGKVVEKAIVANSELDPRLGGVSAARAEQADGAEVEMIAPGRVSIPSTSRPVRVELFEVSLPVRVRLEAAPMRRPVALVVADVENTSGRVLLPGRVSVFRGAAYSGQTELGFVSARERFRIPLGSDASVRIAREVKTLPEKQALLTGAITQAYAQRITLENLSPVPMDIVVRDRVPVSRATEAVVRVGELDRSALLDEETGVYAIELHLAPREKRELSSTYSISSPRGFTIHDPN